MVYPRYVVTGTDTDVGKTVFCAALVGALGAFYWKPVQAGTDESGNGDRERVAQLSGAEPARILQESFRLATPCSPHLAARIDGVEIDPGELAVPDVAGPLVIEGAGGVLVPLTPTTLFGEVFAGWSLPTILVARTALGTINHSLLSIEALRSRGVPIHGIAFSGEENPETESIIARIGKVRHLGRLPRLANLDRDTLAAAFASHFDITDFA
ncbi:MAG: ATP-dependent dethiobiotin synthetase BioD [Novosphingobium sp.]|nr:ATP-dependent dethiobiotin synthetase BioD [Novosphingobium sp.]